jgi:hypothetical protein
MAETGSPNDGSVHAHAIVWIDHLVAKIFPMGRTGVNSLSVHAHLDSHHLHHKANAIGSGKVHEDPSYFKSIDDTLKACTEVLIIGPGNEKTALMRHLQAARSGLTLRVETTDHLTDKEIIALGKRHFHLD